MLRTASSAPVTARSFARELDPDCSSAYIGAMASAWPPGPCHPRLTDGAVHVWRADLQTVGSELGDLLGDEERERAEGILGERERGLWIRSRGVLRALLGRYTQSDPRALRFGANAHGKPALPADEAGSRSALRSPHSPAQPLFNLSHSGGLALYAFSSGGAVGVDIERAGRAIDEVALAARAFGAAEARRLEGLEQAIRRREFLRAWVRHEAALKCRGTGIGAAASDADASEPRDGDEIVGQGSTEPWIAELDVGPGAAGAVALERHPSELHCWEWQL
jgi:4'-phosphopantetheinyl transferase